MAIPGIAPTGITSLARIPQKTLEVVLAVRPLPPTNGHLGEPVTLSFGDVMRIVAALESSRQALENKLRASRHTLSGEGAAAERLSVNNRGTLMLKISSMETELKETDQLLAPLKEEASRLFSSPSRMTTEAAHEVAHPIGPMAFGIRK